MVAGEGKAIRVTVLRLNDMVNAKEGRIGVAEE